MGNTTKKRILDAALVSFVENGYKGTNLRDFAAGLGLSKSALYRHYESKERCFEKEKRYEDYKHFGKNQSSANGTVCD